MRKSFYLLTALGAAGIWIAEALVQVHIAAHFSTAPDTGICAAGIGFSCNDVARSAYASVLGLPIAVLGQAFYGVVLLAAFALRFAPARLPRLADALLLASGLGVLYSLFLGGISKAVLGVLCPYCLLLYGVNLGLLLTLWFGHPEGDPRRALRTLLSLPKASGPWALGAVMVVATVGAQAAYAHRARIAHHAFVLQQASQAPARPVGKQEIEIGRSPARGPADAVVTVVEFSDFECPYCQVLAQSLKTAQADGAGPFKYHFRHWPMDDACNPHITRKFHEGACLAAYATECAGSQGRFWEMHDTLFDNRRRLAREDLLGYAARLGLDPERFSACLDDPATKAAVQADIAAGFAAGVGGTPMWFINGWRIEGARKPADLAALVDQAAQNAKAGRSTPPGP